MSSWRTPNLREKLSEAQNHRCCYCGFRTNESNDPRRVSTIEHVVPRSLDGPDHYDNFVMACWACNNAYGSAVDEVRKIEGLLKKLDNAEFNQKTTRRAAVVIRYLLELLGYDTQT